MKMEPGSSAFKMTPKVGSNMVKSVYAAGTAYQLTNTAALANLGTTPASITLDTPGTYLIFARLRLDYTGATFAAVRTVTAKLRRINNTAADLTNASAGLKTSIITALTYTAGDINIPPVVYTTDRSDDNIQIFASVDTVPSAGSMDVVEAEIIAVKIT